jgi:hypothetical protein
MKDNKSYDIDWLNSLPVNIKSKEMLIAAGQKPDPASLYSVQLAKWSIEKGMIEAESSVVETVEAMMTWRPARLANFFIIGADGAHNPEGWENALTPVGLANTILNEIEARMMLHFPWYSSLEI